MGVTCGCCGSVVGLLVGLIFLLKLLIYIVFSRTGATHKAGYIYISKISSIFTIYMYSLIWE